MDADGRASIPTRWGDGGSLSTLRAFRRVRMRPTVELEAYHPSSLSSTTSLSFPTVD